MKKTAYGLLLIILLIFLTNCQGDSRWLSFRGVGGSGTVKEKINTPLAIKWKLKLQEEKGDKRSFNPPKVWEDTIYFGSMDGNFYAFDINSGFMHWVFKAAAPINSIPHVDKDSVFFGCTDGNLYALDRKSGDLKWTFYTGNPVNSSVVGYQDQIVFTSDAGATFFLGKDGQLVNQLPNRDWSHHCFHIYDDVVYFTPGPDWADLSFGVYDIRKEAYLWILRVDGEGLGWYSFPGIGGDILYYSQCTYSWGNLDLAYYALDREDGEVIWKRERLSPLFSDRAWRPERLFLENIDLLDFMAPSIWKGLVIYSSGDHLLRAFDRYNGDTAWEKKFDQPLSSATIIAGNRIYFGLRGNKTQGIPSWLLCLSASNAVELWRMEIEGDLLSAPVISGSWMVFGTDQHNFYVLEEIF